MKLECNNCRMGEGFWRRGGEKPSAVKWEDRIIEIREGSWSYVAGSIGRAPGTFYIAIYVRFVDCLHRDLRQFFVKKCVHCVSWDQVVDILMLF